MTLEMKAGPMPYLNCRDCRLTVYSAAAHSTVERCPRCDGALSARPRSLFDSPALDGRAKHTDRTVTSALAETQKLRQGRDFSQGRASRSDGDGRHSAIREALRDTGIFRDSGSQGQNPAA